MESSAFDRKLLATEAYADPTRLRERISLYAYRQPPVDWIGWLAGPLVDVPGPVVDIGCGPGDLVRALRAQRPDRTVIGLDLSPGMVAVAGRPAAVGDAMALPLADRGCGGVTAMHMMYHVPEPEVAVAELARVRRPDGTVVIATNASGDKRELGRLRIAATRDVTGVAPEPSEVARRFTLDHGEALARKHFGSVERIEQRGEIVLTDPEPVVRFVASTWNWHGDGLPTDVIAAIEDRMRARIRAAGTFRITSHNGVLVCR